MLSFLLLLFMSFIIYVVFILVVVAAEIVKVIVVVVAVEAVVIALNLQVVVIAFALLRRMSYIEELHIIIITRGCVEEGRLVRHSSPLYFTIRFNRSRLL